MIVDPHVITLFIAGSSKDPQTAFVTHMLQGASLEAPDTRTLAEVRAYLTRAGYSCFLPACERSVSIPRKKRGDGMTLLPEYMTVGVEFWRKPDDGVTVKKSS